jgi:hypothetical protein
MLSYIYHALHTFRKTFSRKKTWLTFCAVIIGFIGVTYIDGVSSICRFWHLQTLGYYALLQLFNSTAWSLPGLLACWWTFVLSQNQTVTIDGRAILLGDHTMASKDGRYMPGVVTLHQDSETQSKPNYFRGHFWSAIALLVGTLQQSFSLPLSLKIHQGFKHLRQDEDLNHDPKTLAPRLIQMAIDFAVEQNLPSILVLDAFFSVASVFKLASSVWSVAIQKPMLTILTRAKKSYVAYFPAQQPEKRGAGRPKTYGEKVHLYEFFDHLHLFQKTQCLVYGQIEQVPLLAINLVWKPTSDFIRFILAITSRGPIVLMCSDLEITPVAAIELYCSRVREETMFSMLKNLIGAFRYRFWSKKMPRHSRKPVTNTKLKAPSLQGLKNVLNCWERYERFVMLAAIALGLLQLVALKFPTQVWARFNGFLRTYSRSIPSEKTVKQVISQMLIEDFLNVAPSATMQEIQTHFLISNKTQKDEHLLSENYGIPDLQNSFPDQIPLDDQQHPPIMDSPMQSTGLLSSAKSLFVTVSQQIANNLKIPPWVGLRL